MNIDARIYVAGSDTFLGQALLNGLRARGYRRVCGDMPGTNLANAVHVDRAFERTAPEIVFHAGGPSGGIQANVDRPAALMRDNLLATTHVIDAAYRLGATKVFYIASSCCYPRKCAQPMREAALNSGPLEPTNAAYATAKLAGIRLCEAYSTQYGLDCVALIPSNVYGPGEDPAEATGHVIGALVARFEDAMARAKSMVSVWGTGQPKRDFLYVDDFVEACVCCIEHDVAHGPINIGSGKGISIRAIAEAIADVAGFQGTIEFDATRPDGMPEKVLNTGRIRALGWQPHTSLESGLAAAYAWYCADNTLVKGAVG